MPTGRLGGTKITVAWVHAMLAVGWLGGCDVEPGTTGFSPSYGGPVCGDGVCAPGESAATCPTDCPPPPRCGDGVCGAGETCASCPIDCGACAPACVSTDLGVGTSAGIQDSTAAAPSGVLDPSCGDGTLGPVQRYTFLVTALGRYTISASGTFPIAVDARGLDCGGGYQLGCGTADSGGTAAFEVDLPAGQPIFVEVSGLGGAAGDFSLDIVLEPPVCGDGFCVDGETCASCPDDCGACRPPPPTCGNGACEAGETCESCAADCGDCSPTCGNGVCEPGEGCGSCPADCGACSPPPTCGDGVCSFGETCASCPFDCGQCGPTFNCGDGVCDLGEDCSSCSTDCGTCSPSSSCGDGTCDGGEDCVSCSYDCGPCGGDWSRVRGSLAKGRGPDAGQAGGGRVAGDH
jgi:hypothetical protein